LARNRALKRGAMNTKEGKVRNSSRPIAKGKRKRNQGKRKKDPATRSGEENAGGDALNLGSGRCFRKKRLKCKIETATVKKG